MESVLGNMNPVLQMLTVMSLFSLLPFVFCCMTSFLRFTIVFSLLKTAMGVQVPPSIVTIGLCMILTFYTMGGVFEKMYERGSIPYQKNQNLIMAIEEGSKPLKEFMLKQTRQSDLDFFLELSHKRTQVKSPDDISIWQVAPAYIISELKTAFEISFIIFVPFIILDLVVANILLALGMFMLSPTIISMPFKLLIFIAVDGWALIVQGLVSSFN